MNDTWETYAFSGDSINNYGIEVVKENLRQKGIICKSYDPDSTNPVLVSLYWPEQIYDFIRWRYLAKNINRTVLVGGNYATTSPQLILASNSYAYLGDGELFDGNLSGEYVLAPQNETPKRRATVATILPQVYEDLQITRRGFVELSRGCRNRCLFCQYAWLKRPYRESPLPHLLEVLGRIKTKSVRCFGADRFAYSQYPSVVSALKRWGKNDTGSDVSARFMLLHPEYLDFTRKIRLGIEGLSERLRNYVHKPISDDEIINLMTQSASRGIKSLDWYMIYGLPTETEADAEAFVKLLCRLNTEMPKDAVIALHWNAFSPNAQTPFQWAASANAPNKHPYMRQIFAFRSPELRIMHKPRLTGLWTIVRRMLAFRAPASLFQLIWNIAIHPSKFSQAIPAIQDAFQKATGRNLLGEWPTDAPFPWDVHCDYGTESMSRIWKQRQRVAEMAG